jgi:uncharacterized protein (TIGR02186 family)
MKKLLLIVFITFFMTTVGGFLSAGTATEEASTHAPAGTEAPAVLEGVSGFTTNSNQSKIETGITYDGQRIDFFGSLDGIKADQLIVKLTSPAETVKINVKGRFGPFWMNTRQYEVDNVPSIYKVRSSGTLSEILSPELAAKLGIGFLVIKDQLKFHILKGTEEKDDQDTVFNGLVQLKKKDELYSIDESGDLQIKDGKLFQHYFRFPPAAKPGTYNVESFLIKDKELVGYSKDTILIEKVGLVAFIAKTSKTNPVLYGLFSVLIALGTGLLVGFIFKGGGHH